MTARLLAESGIEVTTLLLGAPAELKGDAAAAWRELKSSAAKGHLHVINTPEDLARHTSALNTDLLMDAVLGTGFKPPLKGLALAALEWIKPHTAPVLAIDLPSGWSADETSATVDGPVFPADAVITFTAPKPAHVFGQLTRHWNQPIVVAPIGSPDAAIISSLQMHWAGSALALAQTPRPAAFQQGKLRPRPGCRRNIRLRRRQVGRAFDDCFGSSAIWCRLGYSSGSGAGFAARCGDCARADDLATCRNRFRRDRRPQKSFARATGSAHNGKNSARHRPRHGPKP